jgi:hypothetical protein
VDLEPHIDRESGPVFGELTRVMLTRPVFVQEANRELPAGSRGTVVAIWQDGKAYDVEFALPFPCLVTVRPERLAA